VKPLIVSEYVQPGTVQFVYLDYAFRGEQAVRAAEAAACAADQGAYWQYHETLFLNQTGPASFVDDRLKAMAAELGLDTGSFNSCLDSGEKRAEVEASVAAAREQNVDSTPTLFVDGTEIEAWQDFNAVSQAIEAAAAG
jgi:protein-disulfide isomerase